MKLQKWQLHSSFIHGLTRINTDAVFRVNPCNPRIKKFSCCLVSRSALKFRFMLKFSFQAGVVGREE